MRSVAARLRARSASDSFCVPTLGFDRSTARLCVAKVLITSMLGAASPSFQTTCRNSAPYFGSLTISALLAFDFHVLPAGLNQSASENAGSGIHAWVLPCAFGISSFVVTSILRQVPGRGANSARAAQLGSALAAEAIAPAFSTSRLVKVIGGAP